MAKGTLKVRGRSYDSRGNKRLDWPRDVDYCWTPPGKSEVWHTFDAQYGPGGAHSAHGVTNFRFDARRLAGEWYYVTYGGGDIRQGSIDFTLEKVTPELRKALALPVTELQFDDLEGCTRFIRAVHRRRA